MREPEIRRGAAGTILVVSVLAIAGYLGLSTLQGNNGLFRLFQIEAQEAKLQDELASLRQERAEIEIKTRQLSETPVDPDILEEQARRVLGLARADEVLLTQSVCNTFTHSELRSSSEPFQPMFHDLGRLAASRLSNHSSGNTCDGLAWRDVAQNDRSGGNATATPDRDISKNRRSCPDQDAVLNFRMPVPIFLARPPKGDGMKHRDVVPDNCSLADHDGMGVINHHTLSHTRARMDVDPESLRRPHLYEVGHICPTFPPQPVCQAIALKGLKTLEKEQRLQVAVAGRIALVNGNNVCAGRHEDLGIILVGFVRQLAQDKIAHFLRGKLLRNPETQRAGKAAMVENPRVNGTRHQGLSHRHLLGFPANDGPNAIQTRDARLRLGQSCAPMALRSQPI